MACEPEIAERFGDYMSSFLAGVKTFVGDFLQTYLIDNDIDKCLTMVSDSICYVGNGQEEVVISKSELKIKLMEGLTLIPGIFYVQYDKLTAKQTGDQFFIVFGNIKIGKKVVDNYTFFVNYCFTSCVKYVDGNYMIETIHLSMASSLLEESKDYSLPYCCHKSNININSDLQKNTMELFNNIISGGMLGVYIEKNYPVFYINDGMLHHLGYSTFNEFTDDTKGFISNVIYEEDLDFVESALSKVYREGDELEVQYRMYKKDKTLIWIMQKGKFIKTADNKNAILGVCLDITHTKQLQSKLEKIAYVDAVTGGNNKSCFEILAKELMINSEDTYAIVYTNIDKFKLINDRFGKETADTILTYLDAIILKELGDGEVNGRLAADNFGILFKYHTTDELKVRLSSLSIKASQIAEKLQIDYGITMSFGIYITDDKNVDIVTMVDRANLSRNHLVRSDAVSFGIYSKEMKEAMIRDKNLEDRMFDALANHEFIVYFQPKYELETKNIIGAEALVRWDSPTDGFIYPNTFIPLFERNAFIIKLDLYVFEEVCKTIRRWLDEGLKPVAVSVNLSKANLDIHGFLGNYKKIIAKYDIPCNYLEFEFTENLVYDNVPLLIQLINEIHEMGCLCSMDDFGSGYSSLNLLKSIFVDILKIDRVFFEVSDEELERSQDVIRGVVALAKSLNLKTVSEGIETMSQVEFLETVGCDMIQGFVYAKPMPISDFETLIFHSCT